jgi:hypothetical protein
MDSSYQVQETHYGDLSLSVHDRINDLHRRADRLAPRMAEQTLDAGCTNLTVREHGELGPRQRKAWDMVAEAHGWNAISDNPRQLALAERLEQAGCPYKVGYGPDGFGVQVPQCQAETTDHACVLDDDGHTGHRDGAFSWTGQPVPEPEGDPTADPEYQVWAEMEARYDEAEDQVLRVSFDSGAGHYRATCRDEPVAFAKWSGDVLRVYLPGGTFVGRLYRSDGKIIAGETVYSYRAWTGTDPLRIVGGEREVARGASLADAIGGLLKNHAMRQASDRWAERTPSYDGDSRTPYEVLAAGLITEDDFWLIVQPDPATCPHRRGTIDWDSGLWHCYACGEYVDTEAQAEADAAYYVTSHDGGRDVVSFSYSSPMAGEAFDKALAAARGAAARNGHRYDVRHTERGVTTFCVGVDAAGALIWRD